ncbi:MAG: universal stress protein [Gammaproteobacteria bacterium]
MYKHILVAVNESSASKRALEEAIKLAGAQKAQLRLINVFDQSLGNYGEYGWSSSAKTQQELDLAAQKAVSILEEASQLCREAGLEVQTDMPHIVNASIVDKILEEAGRWPADLIVMGTHGRTGVQRLLLGSVAMGVVQGASVPVMLIREHE